MNSSVFIINNAINIAIVIMGIVMVIGSLYILHVFGVLIGMIIILIGSILLMRSLLQH